MATTPRAQSSPRRRGLLRAARVASCAGIVLVASGARVSADERSEAPVSSGPALVLVAHPEVRESDLSLSELRAIFEKRRVRWEGGQPIIPLNAPADSALRLAFDEKVMGWTPSAAADYWIRQRASTGVAPPRQVPRPKLTCDIVARVPGAIGYVDSGTLPQGVKVLRVDGRLPWDPAYGLKLGLLLGPAEPQVPEKDTWLLAKD